MALRLFLFVAGGTLATAFLAFFKEHDFEREPILVFAWAMTAGVVALAMFFYKNRDLFNQMTVEPSTRNVEIWMEFLKRRRRTAAPPPSSRGNR
jgi:hypothetical protein